MIGLNPSSEQTIVIIGASRGTGLVTARTGGKAGAAVIAAARNEETPMYISHDKRIRVAARVEA